MIKLWLDDIRNPIEYIEEIDWIWVKTVGEAKIALLTGQVEEASLDHDLGGHVFVLSDGVEETGYTLVKWMAENDIWPATRPRVHSYNPVGKANMEAVIERYWHPKGEKKDE